MKPGVNINCLVILILFFICNSALDAGESPKKKTKNWQIDLSLNSYYDSNILKYSDKYIQRFLNRQDPGRFHIDRYDDLVVAYSLGISFSHNFFKRLKTTFGTDVGTDVYSFNNIKNWSSFDFYIQQSITPSTSFSISYSYIPEFYVRHFYDDDWVYFYGYVSESFQPYKFSKEDYSFWFQQNFWKNATRVRLYFSYSQYFHNIHYTEFDSDDFLYGIRIYQKIFKNLVVNIGYRYTTSDAKGFDGPGETRELSDDSDASNYEHIYNAGFEYKLPKIFSKTNDISLTVQYQEQFFTTNQFLELDPLHAGRYDYNYRIFANYDFNLFSDLSVSAFYNWLNRSTSTSEKGNQQYISDEKDYTQYQIGLKLKYKIKF